MTRAEVRSEIGDLLAARNPEPNAADQRLATLDFPHRPILSRVRCIGLFCHIPNWIEASCKSHSLPNCFLSSAGRRSTNCFGALLRIAGNWATVFAFSSSDSSSLVS